MYYITIKISDPLLAEELTRVTRLLVNGAQAMLDGRLTQPLQGKVQHASQVQDLLWDEIVRPSNDARLAAALRDMAGN